MESKNHSQLVSGDVAISVQELEVAFRSYDQRPASLKETLIRMVRERKWKYHSEFIALKSISFEVKRGEVFAIIGSNGAGKTTLLRTLVGAITPKSGELSVAGSIDSLIHLGAGFDPDLNAIENIYLNGSLYGYSKAHMKERVDKILEFAELQEFAFTPIRYYSSGMSARLGFSVAIDRDPDILVVDEVLGVGDSRFQAKCDKVFERFLAQKKTIVMVSHAIDSVRKMASRCLLLSAGSVRFIGDVEEAIRIYESDDYTTRLAG
jgi:ABC-type polysaccharide/polyol phosphate transport system ATPase subunit